MDIYGLFMYSFDNVIYSLAAISIVLSKKKKEAITIVV
jgi:antitoxin component HigA of HigAB toxin-antitoxin module